ncbi:MAG TPA: substrate-binding domain-containing protein [Pseudonocardia sp.]
MFQKTLPRKWSLRTAVLAVAVLGATAACGSGGGSAPGDQSTAQSGSDADTAAVVQAAKTQLAQYVRSATTWNGPTSGPPIATGKSIIYVAYDQGNPQSVQASDAVKAIGQSVGWTVTVLDGQGTTSGQQGALTQAIAAHPDGIVLGSYPDSFRPYFKQAHDAGIAVIGLGTAAEPGMYPEYGIDANVFQNQAQASGAAGDWVVVHSNGKARVILTSDNTYSIVIAKTNAQRSAIQKCATCQIVVDTQMPFADAANRTTSLTTGWVNQFGTEPPLYILQPAYYFVPFEAQALRTLGIKPGQVVLTGSNGTAQEYEDIRRGDYLQMTIPLAIQQQGYEVIDNLNRVFHHVQPAGLESAVWVVDASNVNQLGGDKNQFEPSNDYARHYRELWSTGKTAA